MDVGPARPAAGKARSGSGATAPGTWRWGGGGLTGVREGSRSSGPEDRKRVAVAEAVAGAVRYRTLHYARSNPYAYTIHRLRRSTFNIGVRR